MSLDAGFRLAEFSARCIELHARHGQEVESKLTELSAILFGRMHQDGVVDG